MIFLWASRVKSGTWHMLCISKTRADRGKLVLFLESEGQIYPETGLTFEAPKCVLASVINQCVKQNLKDCTPTCITSTYSIFKTFAYTVYLTRLILILKNLSFTPEVLDNSFNTPI
jgi:hypothetical protein